MIIKVTTDNLKLDQFGSQLDQLQLPDAGVRAVPLGWHSSLLFYRCDQLFCLSNILSVF